MSDPSRVSRQEQLRLEILWAMRASRTPQYSGWLSVKGLRAALNQGGGDYTLTEVCEACDYLASAGYIEDESVRGVHFDASQPSYKIAAQGLLLLDHKIPPDPGIEDSRK